MGSPFSPTPVAPAPGWLREPLLPAPAMDAGRVDFLAAQSSVFLRDVFSGQASCGPDPPCVSEVPEGRQCTEVLLSGHGGAPAPLGTCREPGAKPTEGQGQGQGCGVSGSRKSGGTPQAPWR